MTKRIEWVDMYKAIAIIAVVVGHSSGQLNMFIYQFHMAAFFLISGYTSGLKRRGVTETAWNKLCALFFPLCTVFLIFLAIAALLSALGVHGAVFAEPFVGVGFALRRFAVNTEVHISWLGATWFILVLFGIFILQRILFKLCGDKGSLPYFLVSLLVFLLGYTFPSQRYNVDLVMIGQFYFACGLILREKDIFQKFLSHILGNIALFALTLAGLWFFAFVSSNTVDYPSRVFGNPFMNAVAALNGVLFVYLLSFFAAKLPAIVKKPLIFIAKNTIGIVFFHFLCFKLTTLILYLAGIAPAEAFASLTPHVDTQAWWPLYSAVSICASIALWKALCMPTFMNVPLGLSKELYGRAYAGMRESKLIKNKVMPWITIKSASIKSFAANHKAVCLICVLLFIFAMLPLLQTGVIINDEVGRRINAMDGFRSVVDNAYVVTTAQGRLLSFIPYTLAWYFDFIRPYAWVIGTIKTCFIFLNLLVFGVFLYKIFKSKAFAVFTCAAVLVTMPITFEHTLPNAFVEYAVALTILLLSFLCFMRYLESAARVPLAAASVLLFIALCYYEAMIMYTPVYLFLTLRFMGDMPLYSEYAWKERLRQAARKLAGPFTASVLYLALYIAAGIVSPSAYTGNQLIFVSLGSMLKIIGQLVLSSLPGYYWLNPKYRYLYGLYSDHSNFIKNCLTDPRTLAVAVLSAFLLYRLFKKPTAPLARSGSWLPLLAGLCCMVLPAVPNSLGAMYQGTVNAESFIALPVSYLMHFTAIFIICFLAWALIERFKLKRGFAALAAGLIILCIPIQVMNGTFAREQARNFGAMTAAESVLNTQSAKAIIKGSVSAADIFRTRNALFIHDSYWSQYASNAGLSAEIRNEPFNANPVSLYYQEDQFFVLSAEDYRLVLSHRPLLQTQAIRVGDAEYLSADFSDTELQSLSSMDNRFYRYCFKIEAGRLNPIAFQQELFEEAVLGNTLATSQKLSGYHHDGWVAIESELRLRTGPDGILSVSGYYPGEITPELTGTLVINGEAAGQYAINEQLFTLEFDVPANEEILVGFINDFTFSSGITDTRELCFVMVDMKTS